VRDWDHGNQDLIIDQTAFRVHKPLEWVNPIEDSLQLHLIARRLMVLR